VTNTILPFSLLGKCTHPSIVRIKGHGDSIQFESRRPVTFTDPSDDHVLAIQTCPRPNENSLDRTLSSLRNAGLDHWRGPKLIVADGYSPPIPTGWILDARPSPPDGSSKTFMRLLRASVHAAPNLSRITYLQDDVSLVKNALDYIDHVKIDNDLSFISWFSVWDNWQGQGKNSLPLFEIGKNIRFHANPAITMPYETIKILLQFLESGSWLHRNGSDRIPAVALEDGLFASHYPVIAQHTEGTNSACTPDCKSERKSKQFVGEKFDALDLIRAQKPWT
jgi:hypothetical protein